MNLTGIPNRSGGWRRAMLLIALSAAACLSGCSSDPLNRRADRLDARFTPHMPVFLSGPASVLLTNVPSFSAHLEAELSEASAPAHEVSGELLGLRGQLLFAPHASEARRNAGTGSSDTAYAWQTATNGGMAFNESLQGWAPVRGQFAVKSVTIKASPAASETIDGHNCETALAIVTLENGANIEFTLWRATDLAGFPMRVRLDKGAAPLTLNFSKARLEQIDAGLFAAPAGFTAYPSLDVLATELLNRQANVHRGSRNFSNMPEPGSSLDRRRPRDEF